MKSTAIRSYTTMPAISHNTARAAQPLESEVEVVKAPLPTYPPHVMDGKALADDV